MKGINRASEKNEITTMRKSLEESTRFLSNFSSSDVPCIFISYQRIDEKYASEVAEYIKSKQVDVYFDIEDSDLKLQRQINNPSGVTDAIKKGLNNSNYMLVIVSPNTYLSPWVPFEVGYAYDKKGDNLKLLRHKSISKSTLPGYLQVKQLLNGTESLNDFLNSVRKKYSIYENLLSKGEDVVTFSAHDNNPLKQYLDNE